ncbi:zinc-dependent peptidase [Flavobacterium sp.]|uniref:zinc-dependent peptidase n=1 Tax=Flavobacterium sp. TaxID=239 RepID=UPI003D6BCF16
MIESIPVIIIATLFILATSVFFFGSFYLVLEYIYGAFFQKPFYVHFYLKLKKLPGNQLDILSGQFEFFKKLPQNEQLYFEHRVAAFLEKYLFYGREGLTVTDEMKVKIAATSAMLTFGMQKYLYTVFDKIILYPDIYYSQTNKVYHKGEFNPKLKTLVFSWKHFQEGFEFENDNLNLGLHEFAHTLHFQCLRNTSISAIIYRVNYEKLLKEVNHKPNHDRLIESGYFREYAFSNQLEFIAVILEHFFETPEKFKLYFPELYQNVKRMINYKE